MLNEGLEKIDRTGPQPAWRVLCVVGLLLLAGSGCPDEDKPVHPPKQSASVTLKVAVVDDPLLTAAIELLRGEWNAQQGGEIKLVEVAREAALEPMQADLVLFPPVLLGSLAERGRLRPVRASIQGSEALKLQDVFPAVRDRLLSYGGQVMALPIGCATPVFTHVPAGDADGPPARWKDLPQRPKIAATDASSDRLAAYWYLARAVCYAADDTGDAVLFDPQSMSPRITEPPFVRAMERLVHALPARSRTKPVEITGLPQEPGQSAVTWPLRQRDSKVSQHLRVAPLPGASERWDSLGEQWVYLNDPQRVTLLGTTGSLVGVTASSRNAAAAFKLAAWLASPANVQQLATSSPNLANVRSPLSVLPDDWTGADDRRLGRQFADAARQANLGGKYFVFPRIARSEAYLEALGAAVHSACSGKPPADALRSADDRWRQLTEEVGRDDQKSAYLRHLGLLPYEPSTR